MDWNGLFLAIGFEMLYLVWNSQLLPRVCPFTILSKCGYCRHGWNRQRKSDMFLAWPALMTWNDDVVLQCLKMECAWYGNGRSAKEVQRWSVRRRKWAVARSAKSAQWSVCCELGFWRRQCVCVCEETMCVFSNCKTMCVCVFSDCKYVLALFFWCGGGIVVISTYLECRSINV